MTTSRWNLPADASPRPAEYVDAAAAVLLAAVALWTFRSSFGGLEFWVVGMAATAVGIVTAHVTHRLALSTVLSVVAWMVVYVLVGGVLADRSGAVLGVVPSPETVTAAVRGPVEGWKQLLTTVPPVGGSSELLVVPVFLGLLHGAVSTTLARTRWTLLPALPSAVVVALGILCGTLEPVAAVLHGSGVVTLALAWAAIRSHRARPPLTGAHLRGRIASAAVFLAVAAVGGLAIGPSLPLVDARDRTVWRDAFDPPFDPSDLPSPLGYYRKFVKELEDVPLFDVAGLPAGATIRMATLDTYDGIVWKVSGGNRARPGSGGFFARVGTDVEPDFGGETATVRITVPVDSGYDEIWLPTVGEVRSLRFDGPNAGPLAEAYRYNATTDAAATLRPLSAGDEYSMAVTVPSPLDDLDDDAVLGEFDLVPIEEIDGSITGLGSGLVEDVDGVERVRILADYLRRTGFYSDATEESGHALVPPGHGIGRLKAFADSSVLVGNAEQYAATLGLILRSSGIPARVVVGFVPSEYDPDGVVTVTGADAEAWVEVLVDGVGWVAVDPTPERTRTTVEQDNTPRPIPDRETQVPPPPPVVEADAETDPAGESEQQARERDEEDDEDDEETGGGGVRWLLLLGGLGLAVPLLALVGFVTAVLVLKRARRRRRRSAPTVHQSVAGAWDELLDWSLDLGVEVPSDLTRREVARVLEVPDAPSLAVRADYAVFGGDQLDIGFADEYWRDLEVARGVLFEPLSLQQRWRADLSLESLRKRRRAGRPRLVTTGAARRASPEPSATPPNPGGDPS